MKHNQIFLSLQEFVQACRKDQKLMVICYADRAGNPILTYRMSGAWLGSLDIAQGKAYTAVAFSGPTEDQALPTADLAELAPPGKPLYGIESTNKGRLVVFGGGIPVYENGQLTGAIGVSGSTVDDDVKFAELAVKALLANSESDSEPEEGEDEEDEEDEGESDDE